MTPEAASNPVPIRIECPNCGAAHIDEGEWATHPHRTHQCQSCGHAWRPFLYATVGVAPEAAGGENLQEVKNAAQSGVPVVVGDHGATVQTSDAAPTAPSGEQTILNSVKEFYDWWFSWPERVVQWRISAQVAAIEFAEAYFEHRLPTLRRERDKLQQTLADESILRATAEAQLRELTARFDIITDELKTANEQVIVAEKREGELRSTIERLEGELGRFTSLEAHLPPGYAVGDDATAELAVKLAEVGRQLAELRSGK